MVQTYKAIDKGVIMFLLNCLYQKQFYMLRKIKAGCRIIQQNPTTTS